MQGQNLTSAQLLDIFYANPAKLLASFAAFIIFALITNSGFIAMRLGLTKAIIQKRPMSISNAFSYGQTKLKDVLLIKILQFFLIALVALVIIVISLVLSLVNEQIMVIILILLTLIAIILLGLGLLFSYAILFIMETTPFNAVKKSFVYFFSHKKTAITAVLLIILVVIPSIILNFADLSNIKALSAMALIARIIYGLILTAWKDLFIFNIYNSNKNFH
ncbi:hypothetical protein J4409_00300 [Candidatus Woesearchaeota archaeon]|nr:hypothetical protein [Candidatus Woesearchaeota archaeon]